MAALVERQGWKVVDRNYRTRAGEIDLIALDGDVLVFIEVRARTGSTFGVADETVTYRKLQRITTTALSYLEEHPDLDELFWRVDLFAISLGRGERVLACRHYENLTLD